MSSLIKKYKSPSETVLTSRKDVFYSLCKSIIGQQISVNCHGLVLHESLDENLKKWFKDKWVRMGPGGKIRGSCGGKSKGEGKPKCLPRSKAYALGKKGRASAARRKRKKDPNPDRRGKAINVNTKKKK